jgi:hypothetical protein
MDRIQPEFHYFGPAFTAEEQTGIAPAQKRVSLPNHESAIVVVNIIHPLHVRQRFDEGVQDGKRCRVLGHEIRAPIRLACASIGGIATGCSGEPL